MLNQLPSFKNLQKLAKNNLKINQKNYDIKLEYLYCNYSNNLITPEILDNLSKLALSSDINNKIKSMFNGDKINTSENRQVLHTALRDPNTKISEILATKNKMRELCEKISDQNITDIINIGIGGSDLGPKMAYNALRPYHNKKIKIHYVSNIDPTEINTVLDKINIQSSLFIISSKSFSTIETLTNAKIARDAGANNFIAITANTEKAVEFGVDKNNIFPMWDFVGGRYSLWSAIGLPIALGTSWEIFEKLLAGAHEMDNHFENAQNPLENLPVILSLLSIWYRNFVNTNSEAIIPYSSDLKYFVDHMQQLIMESNGKSISIDNKLLDYKTCPIIWGGIGTNCQHAFMQLLHQGTDVIPCDFIAPVKSFDSNAESQKILLANLFAQCKTLKDGDNNAEIHKNLTNNKPSNIILFEQLTPEVLGSLIALYEHKTFAQGILWNINSFDQWGVEKGKICAGEVIKEISDCNNLEDYISYIS